MNCAMQLAPENKDAAVQAQPEHWLILWSD